MPTAPTKPPVSITNLAGITLKRIPAGVFVTGSLDTDKETALRETLAHNVQISAFYLGITVIGRAPTKIRWGLPRDRIA
jgi:hypothetical protein